MSEFIVLTNLDIYLAVAVIIKKCDKFSILRIVSPFLSDIPPVFINGLSDELSRKANKGAKIQILTRPPRRYEILALLDRWMESGIKIKTNPRIHGKTILFERKVFIENRLTKEEYTTLIGSANLTRPGLSIPKRGNLEIVLRSHKKDIFEKIQLIYNRWWSNRESEAYLSWKYKTKRNR